MVSFDGGKQVIYLQLVIIITDIHTSPLSHALRYLEV